MTSASRFDRRIHSGFFWSPAGDSSSWLAFLRRWEVRADLLGRRWTPFWRRLQRGPQRASRVRDGGCNADSRDLRRPPK
eukprot:4448070-Pyramimonas_sp.AAC.1